MGFEILGYRFFDLSAKVTYGDAFIGIVIVCFLALLSFLFVKTNTPKNL